MGVFVFILILLMFQALRLTEFILVHGVGWKVIGQIALYLSVSFLPAILPMSLLFAVLMTYSRLSNDSEIIALRSAGINMISITLPAFILSALVAFLSLYTLFKIGPWGNRQFEILITKLGHQKAASQIREGTFSEGFFDLVIYANKVDSNRGRLSDVFIFDERNEGFPVTIIAKEGRIIQDKNALDGVAKLKLINGNMHRTSTEGKYTRLNFRTYNINLINEDMQDTRKKSPPSLRFSELRSLMKDKELKRKKRRKFATEFHKRWAISFACVIFGLLGVGLGTVNNKRAGKSYGMVLCLAVIVLYWALYISMEGSARSGSLPVVMALWIPNLIFLLTAGYSLKRVWD